MLTSPIVSPLSSSSPLALTPVDIVESTTTMTSASNEQPTATTSTTTAMMMMGGGAKAHATTTLETCHVEASPSLYHSAPTSPPTTSATLLESSLADAKLHIMEQEGARDVQTPPMNGLQANVRSIATDTATATATSITTVTELKEQVVVSASPVELPAQPEYNFAWSVATQKGYRYASSLNRDRKLDIHTEMEDMYYPSQNETPNNIHPITGRPYQLFMLADGHGGHRCAQYAVATLPPAVIELFNSRAWDVRSPEDQQVLRKELQTIFLEADQVYCARKLEEFRHWMNTVVRVNGGSPSDPKNRAFKPADDGCTLVVNILYDGYLVNCNVGDSRSLMLRSTAASEQWVPEFSSIDHTPGHPEKASMIQSNGGRYILNGTTADVSLLVQEVHVEWAETDMLLQQQAAVSMQTAAYSCLTRCRIGRPLNWKISEIDVPASTTLNLTGTMGDLFFKYNPSLITARPDVTFVPMQPLENRRYMLVMATDGLWDHMTEFDPVKQASVVSEYVENTMSVGGDNLGFMIQNGKAAAAAANKKQRLDGFMDLTDPLFLDEDMVDENSDDSDSGMTADVQQKLQKLGVLAHGLCDREMLSSHSDLFARGYLRYDDATAFVVLIEGPSDGNEIPE